MRDGVDKVKKVVATVMKVFSMKLVVIVLIIMVLTTFLASAMYFITVDDGTYKEDDWSSTPYGASQYISNVVMNNDGTLNSNITAQELWDKMMENNSRVNLYLDSPEELLKLMNAEMVTQFVNTDPDNPIDWDSINDINSTELQGIIKLKRADANGKTFNMKYADEATFQSYIDEYNKTGSETAKKNALKHFTLGTGSSSSAGGAGGILTGTGDFTKYDLTEQQLKAIANLCKQEQGTLKGAAAEASLMANRFELVGSSFGTGGSGLYNYVRTSGWFAYASKHMDNGSASSDYVDVIRSVLVNGKRTLPGYVDEHDCFSDISSASNNGSGFNVSDRSQYQKNVTIMNNVYGATYTFYCFPTDTSDPFGYTSEANRQRIGDAYYDYDTGELVNGTGSEGGSGAASDETSSGMTSTANIDEWYWPTDGTTITSTFGPRSAPIPGASTDHGAIDIGVPEGTNVYACDAGKVTVASYQGNAGNMVTIDHGNGYTSTYMHNSEFKVAIGDQVTKGQVIALSGNTGNSSGPHLHFQVQYNGEKLDPLNFKYHNGMGDGTISVQGSGIESLQDFLFIGDSILGTCKSGLESEGAKVIYQVSANANFFLGKVSSPSSEGVCSSGENFNWDTHIGSVQNPKGIYLVLGQNLCDDGVTSYVENGVNDIKELVNKLQQQFPDVPIFINSVIPVASGYGNATKYIEGMKKANELLTSYCSSANDVTYVNVLNGFTEDGSEYAKSEFLSGDYQHPNSTGADKLIENIKKGVIGHGANGGANGTTGSSTSKYYAKVATWSETTNKITSNDPKQEEKNETRYNMTTTNVNYQDFVSGYTMPFDYLWALLVVSEDKDFVLELAELVHNSKIEITIHDNLTKNTNVKVSTYTEKKKTDTSARVTVRYKDEAKATRSASKSGTWSDEEKNKYKTTYTTITKTNTLDIKLTLADVWMAKYTQEFKYEKPEDVVTTTNNTLADIDYQESENSPTSNDTYGHAADLLADLKKTYKKYNPIGNIDYLEERIYNATVDRNEKITNTLKTTKYVSSPSNIEGKIDKDASEDNFVKLFLKRSNSKAKNNILNVESWLFELIETNDSTKDMLDLTKYLLYKATGVDYGVTEFDFDALFRINLTPVGTGDYIVEITKSPEEIVITDVETLKTAFAGYSGSSELLKYTEEFLEYQEKYKVNAVFAAAVSISETSAGRAGHATDGKNNWFNIECTCGNSSHGRFETYEHAEKSIERFFWQISEGNYYFTEGNYTVTDIGMTYRENADAPGGWIENTNAFMTQMFQAAGIELNSGTGESTVIAAEGDGYSQEFVSRFGRTYKEFKQSRGSYAHGITYSGGDISSSGCGPTSATIVASGYGYQGHPGSLILSAREKYGVSNFQASGPSTGKMLTTAGIPFTHKMTSAVTTSDLSNHLMNTGPIVTSVGNACGNLFTSASHFIAILDISDDGSQVYVANPSMKKHGWTDINQVITCINSWSSSWTMFITQT